MCAVISQKQWPANRLQSTAFFADRLPPEPTAPTRFRCKNLCRNNNYCTTQLPLIGWPILPPSSGHFGPFRIIQQPFGYSSTIPCPSIWVQPRQFNATRPQQRAIITLRLYSMAAIGCQHRWRRGWQPDVGQQTRASYWLPLPTTVCVLQSSLLSSSPLRGES